MSPVAWKGLGAGCFVLSVALVFVALERYDSNRKAVAAFNAMTDSPLFGGEDNPLGGLMKQMTGRQKLEPGVPGATIGALTLAALSVVGGVTCLALARKRPPSPAAEPPVVGGV